VRVDLPTPGVALAIAAHPDDVEFQCGATFAKWSEAGAVVHHLICTDGSKGSWDASADTAALVALRQVEQREAARRLGSTGEVRFLGQIDGELGHGLGLRGEVARVIRELKPDVVLGHDPWKRWRIHPDHRAAGWLAVEGVVAARDPHFFPEHGVSHHRPEAILLFETDGADHAESLTDRHVDAKIAALLAHESQFETTMYIDLDEADTDELTGQTLEFRDRIMGECREAGRFAGVPLAETFHLIDDI